LSKNDFRYLTVEEQVDLLRPGDTSSIPKEVWDAWKQDEMYADYLEDAHRIEEEENLIARLEENPELLDQISERIAEIKNHQPRQLSLSYRSKLKQQVLLALLEKPGMEDREVCTWLDYHWEDLHDLPYGKPFAVAYEGKERSRLHSRIGKVRADLRRALQSL
jgi:hypothetical protein